MTMEMMVEDRKFRVKSLDQLEFVLDDIYQRVRLSQVLLNILLMSKKLNCKYREKRTLHITNTYFNIRM